MKKIAFFFIIFTSNTNAECISKDLTDPTYLKSSGKEKLIEHFKTPRDQDGVSWCGAFASSDSLSFAVGEPISAIDISINFYSLHVDTKENKLTNLGLISPLSALTASRLNGYCPESIIPSNQTFSSNLGSDALSKLTQSFQKIFEDYEAKGRPDNYCADCTESYIKTIKPSLPHVTSDMINSLFTNNQQNGLITFKNLFDKLCVNKRIKVERKYDITYKNQLKNKSIVSLIDQALNDNSMPTIGTNTSSFTDSSSVPGGHGPHSMVVVARRMSENKCEYLVRNSWGRSCSYYLPEFREKCDASKGAFWMSQDQLEAAVTDIIVIKNKKSPFKLFKK